MAARDWSHALAEDVAAEVVGAEQHVATEGLLALAVGYGHMATFPGTEEKCRATFEAWALSYWERVHSGAFPTMDVKRSKRAPNVSTLTPEAELLAARAHNAMGRRLTGWQYYGSEWGKTVGMPELSATALLCAAGCAQRGPLGWNPWRRLALEAWDANLYRFEVVAPAGVSEAA